MSKHWQHLKVMLSHAVKAAVSCSFELSAKDECQMLQLGWHQKILISAGCHLQSDDIYHVMQQRTILSVD